MIMRTLMRALLKPHSIGTRTKSQGLGNEFLEELRAAYHRILDHPFGYQDLRSGIRRALTRRFPYAVYFAVQGETVVILAVLGTARDPAEWRRRI